MRFVLIAQPRTGTTVLRNLLNQSRLLYMYGEAFHPAYFSWGWYTYLLPKLQEEPKALLPTNWSNHVTPYLTALFEAKEAKRKAAVGVDIKIPQAQMVRGLAKSIRECGANVLHLRRRNALASIVSYRIMTERVRQGGKAHGTRAVQSEPVLLNVDWLKLRIAEFESEDNMVKWNYRGRGYLELFYEDFIGDEGWQQTCLKLTDFLKLKISSPFEPSLKKQNSSNLADLIVNADEVRKHFPQYFENEQSPPRENPKPSRKRAARAPDASPLEENAPQAGEG
jgi:LPS sulfotransferase NodH